MSFGLLGQKKGMTQIFDKQRRCIPVTIIRAGPCTVVRTKNVKTDGYNAIQLGFEEVKENRLNNAKKKYFAKQNTPPFSRLKEFRFEGVEDFQVGQELTVEAFKPGDKIDVQGVTKGRGFQGVIKKEGKSGGPDAHGSGFHRRTGSIGMNTWPGRVFKNMGMPGRMGSDRVTIPNLEVMEVFPEENVLLVKGSVPGASSALVVIYNRNKEFVGRFRKEEKKEEKK